MREDLLIDLRNGPVRSGEGPGGIELFDIDSVCDVMHEALDEIERLRDMIKRRLNCDSSNGRWDAAEHLALTEEMRSAVKPVE